MLGSIHATRLKPLFGGAYVVDDYALGHALRVVMLAAHEMACERFALGVTPVA